MFHPRAEELDTSAAEIRQRLHELLGERSAALTSDLAEIDSYMADLEADIELWRSLFATAAVTEIATLRAELSAPLQG